MGDGPQSESAEDHFTTGITLSKDQEEGAGLADYFISFHRRHYNCRQFPNKTSEEEKSSHTVCLGL